MIDPTTTKPIKSQCDVIIPAHNAQGFIAEALLSLFEQSYPPNVIIVADDSSTDKQLRSRHSFL